MCARAAVKSSDYIHISFIWLVYKTLLLKVIYSKTNLLIKKRRRRWWKQKFMRYFEKTKTIQIEQNVPKKRSSVFLLFKCCRSPIANQFYSIDWIQMECVYCIIMKKTKITMILHTPCYSMYRVIMRVTLCPYKTRGQTRRDDFWHHLKRCKQPPKYEKRKKCNKKEHTHGRGNAI